MSPLKSGLQDVEKLQGLPEKIEPFVGRSNEIKTATEHLFAQKSICFYGMGGIGKSALAVEIAYKFLIDDQFFDYIIWCPIEERSISVICDTIGDALGIKELFASLDIEQKKLWIRSVLMDKKALIILDNVPDRKYFKELMDATGSATVLTTARSMMTSNSLPSSRCIPINGLEPQHAQSLFVQRAGIESPDMSIVAKICERLGYHPLAIRIAADSPTVKNVGAAKFLDKLRERGIEVVSDADEKDKNYNVMRSFDISYEGLNESDQAVFNHLGVFNGSFDESAVSAISQCDDVEMALEHLVKYSLITQLKTGRYKLHELMKDYANRKFTSDKLIEVKKRYSRYYAKVAEPLGDLPIEQWKEYDADWENIRAGANFATEQMKRVTGNNIGEVHRARGDYEKALTWHEKSMAIEEKIGDLSGLATTYNNIACVHYSQEEYEEASKWYKKSIEIKRKTGDRAGLANTLHNMGWVALSKKDLSKALEYFTQSRDIYIEIKLPKKVEREEEMIAQVKLQMRK